MATSGKTAKTREIEPFTSQEGTAATSCRSSRECGKMPHLLSSQGRRMDVGKPLCAASDCFPIMTAAIKKAVGKKSVQKAPYSSRKTAFPLFRIGRGPKNTEKNGLVSFGKSIEK
jgi:hypothetical protein